MSITSGWLIQTLYIEWRWSHVRVSSVIVCFLRKHFDVAQMGRGVARPPDPVWVRRIELDPSRIRLDDRQRALGPRLRSRIEAGDLVRRLFGHPDHLGPRIGDHVIRAAVLGLRFVERHLAGFLIDLHELAGPMEADPEIALPIRSHPARN